MGSGGAGGPYTVSWDFGDDSKETGSTVVHAYEVAGSYTPKVTITDAAGSSRQTVLAMITVRTPAPEAVAPAGSSPIPANVLVGGIMIAAVGAVIAVYVVRRRSRRR